MALYGLIDDITALANEAPGVVSSILSLVRKVRPVLPTVKLIVDDPAFPQIIERVNVLHSIEVAKPAAPGVPPTTAPVGIGLQSFVKPLDALIYVRRNPWVPWAVGAGLLLIIGRIGYRMGQRSK